MNDSTPTLPPVDVRELVFALVAAGVALSHAGAYSPARRAIEMASSYRADANLSKAQAALLSSVEALILR